MKVKLVVYLVVFFLCGGAIGAWLGQRSAPAYLEGGYCRPASHDELDYFYSEILKVSDEQKQKIMEIEKVYQSERNQFAALMHQANVDLAEVIEKEGYESPKIRLMVGQIHTAMGELQALSLKHLAAIEKLLDPQQAALLKENAVLRLRQN